MNIKLSLFAAMIVPFVLTACGESAPTTGDEANATGETYDIKWTPEAGTRYVMMMTSNEEVITRTEKGEEVTGMKMELRLRESVNSVESNGDIKVSSMYGNINYTMRMPGQAEVSYNSDNEPIDEMSGMMKSMIGKKSDYTQTNRGILTEVNSELNADFSKTFVSDSYTYNDNLREMITTWAAYPDKPVKVGESWTTNRGMRSMYPMVMEDTWTLESADSVKYVIKVSGKISPNPEAVASNEMGMPIKWEWNGTRTGTFELSRKNGAMMTATLDVVADGKMIIVSEEKGKDQIKPAKLSRKEVLTFQY